MKTENNILLNVEKLAAGYGKHMVLEEVSFDVRKGEVFGIIGQNGSGKSTLLKVIYGLIPLKNGIVEFSGQNLSQIQAYHMVRYGVSFFTQGGLIMPALTVEEHLSLAVLQNGAAMGKTTFDPVFEQFNILHKLRKQRAGSLSGGERQMLSFGILIMQDTDIWFLDEPTAGLSPDMVKQSVEFLQKMNRDEGITMLLVEHNMEVACTLSNSIAVTKEGTLTQKFNRQEYIENDFLTEQVYN